MENLKIILAGYIIPYMYYALCEFKFLELIKATCLSVLSTNNTNHRLVAVKYSDIYFAHGEYNILNACSFFRRILSFFYDNCLGLNLKFF